MRLSLLLKTGLSGFRHLRAVAHFSLLGTVVALVSGCGQFYNVRSLSTAYAAPATGESARLRVTSDGMVRAVPGRDCLDWNSPGAGVMVAAQSGFTDRNGEHLGMPGVTPNWPGAVSTELTIPADKPTAFHYLGPSQLSRQCFNTLTFVPKAGMDYVLRVTTAGGCGMQLSEIRATDGKTVSVESAQVQVGKVSMCNVMDNF